MWIIGIIVVIGILYILLTKKGKEIQQTNREGGMLIKYAYIVHKILEQDTRAQISHESGDTIQIDLKTAGGVTSFILKHNSNRLLIKWKSNNLIYGQHNLRWEFAASQSQVEIMNKVERELASYQNKIISNRGLLK
ncbi:MAG: hypothetical protein JST86_03285 [Bacteroidetes bacterium]|nr:hypothetical protein [Bacteroidota bacterium]